MRPYALRSGKQSFSLSAGTYRIGRSPTSDICIDDASVSRAHATLRVDRERVVIDELGSRNGVRVNGAVRRGATVLTPGDRVQFGEVEFELVVSEQVPDERSGAPTRPMPKLTEPRGPVLSGRETEVLEMIARGVTQREIAETLGLSVKTIETYRARIAEKLGLETRAALVDYAIRSGVLRARRSSPPKQS
jgi:pSer/pThr/pTyr-binding forkhead associated (FHA) protein